MFDVVAASRQFPTAVALEVNLVAGLSPLITAVTLVGRASKPSVTKHQRTGL